VYALHLESSMQWRRKPPHGPAERLADFEVDVRQTNARGNIGQHHRHPPLPHEWECEGQGRADCHLGPAWSTRQCAGGREKVEDADRGHRRSVDLHCDRERHAVHGPLGRARDDHGTPICRSQRELDLRPEETDGIEIVEISIEQAGDAIRDAAVRALDHGGRGVERIEDGFNR
jgi:hypothetical protein